MYYEFYIDQFFLEHLLIGYLLIAVSVILQKMDVPWKRIAAGSAANAILMTAFVCMGLYRWCLLAMPAAGAVVFLGKKRKEFAGGMIFLLLVTICFGGALEVFTELMQLPVLIGAALSVMAVRVAGGWLEKRRMKLAGIVTVTLQWEERTETLCGMIDTGNRLTEPLTGHPVSIVDSISVKKLLGEDWENRRGFYLIPYHSIGMDKGWMRGVTIDSLCVKSENGSVLVQNPILAIYEGRVSSEEQYQMILNPMHAET